MSCSEIVMTQKTEYIDRSQIDLDLHDNNTILQTLLDSQANAVSAVSAAIADIDRAVAASAERLTNSPQGRLILAGAGASGRLAVQDGAEMWPTFGWPHDRLLLSMAGGDAALIQSVEGVEDDADAANEEVAAAQLTADDVVLAIAASGESRWTCEWLRCAKSQGAVAIGIANNQDSTLLKISEHPVHLDSGAEVLAGSTRMAAGTAQKIALNLFSTTLMIRLNRTYGNLMIDMAAVNNKLEKRRIRLLQGVLPDLADDDARRAVEAANGWVKLAALLALGETESSARARLETHRGSLRAAMKSLDGV